MKMHKLIKSKCNRLDRHQKLTLAKRLADLMHNFNPSSDQTLGSWSKLVAEMLTLRITMDKLVDAQTFKFMVNKHHGFVKTAAFTDVTTIIHLVSLTQKGNWLLAVLPHGTRLHPCS
ncbi:uncharacterized protein VP01_5778g2 [Puccinia sorghi]|uniref:Uncharacterized protein n=1 Tax=Puccinia sorghi TaxID=27349 RepID=A0A0L6UIA0_9BASI|nr:uncharacterized protein VP01_5778g2 [Puccinia sorghi]